jgi:effector-binding domain-containing protein
LSIVGGDDGRVDYEVSLTEAVSREVGVLLDQPCPLAGRVVASALPAGTAAMTVHRGPFGGVGAAHDAILAWCAAHGHRPSGTRWEVYGPNDADRDSGHPV